MNLTSQFTTSNPPLMEYPRPTLQRKSYQNLNGIWDYAFTHSSHIPTAYDGKILVPFSPECKRSLVNRQLKPNEYLWYHRTFSDLRKKKEERLLLNFGAVDQYARIYVNHQFVKSHTGGYLPFTCDITPYLKEGENSLIVAVRDVSDTSYHTRGKQKLHRGGMFYTAQSGIWQTVFLEAVPATYIKQVFFTPNLSLNTIEVSLTLHKSRQLAYPKAVILIQTPDGIHKETLDIHQHAIIHLPHVAYWSPEHPYLYHAQIICGKDRIKTYFAMRSITVCKDQNHIPRIYLNGKPYFQTGVLDQGYWPESLYTPPSDEAMIHDIKMSKAMGFNLLRKHAKVECDRWYYHCDRLGMLVWQDMVNGGSSYHNWFVTYFPTVFPKIATLVNDNNYYLSSRTHKKGREEYVRELKDMILALYNHPSIVMWVAFNEGWGQFHTVSITRKIKRLDPYRLVDSSSGWFDQKCGDVRSLHIYFTPFWFSPHKKRALTLSEFGGYTLQVKNHCYCDSTYGYRHYATKSELMKAIENVYYKKIYPGIAKGLCACVYTQLSDIEDEINGLTTYDRKVVKVDINQMKTINNTLTRNND